MVRELVGHGVPVRELYEALFTRSLDAVGSEWEANRISVATEHLATGITEGLMNQLYERISSPQRTGRRAMIACVSGELHQVGARMAADVFEMNGWDADFIGANTPAPELARMVGDRKPDVVGLSISLFFNLDELLRQLEQLANEHPETTLVVGGQAATGHLIASIDTRIPTVVLPDLEAIDRFTEDYEAGRNAP